MQKGEAAITMTLIGLGLMAIGVLIGVVAVKYTPLKSLLKAQGSLEETEEVRTDGNQIGVQLDGDLHRQIFSKQDANEYVAKYYPKGYNVRERLVRLDSAVETEENGRVVPGNTMWQVQDDAGDVAMLLQPDCANEALLWRGRFVPESESDARHGCDGVELLFRSGTGTTKADWTSVAPYAFTFRATISANGVSQSVPATFDVGARMYIPYPDSLRAVIDNNDDVQIQVRDISINNFRPRSLKNGLSTTVHCRTSVIPTATPTPPPAGEPSNTPEPTRPIGGNPTPAACPPLPDVSLGLSDCANREVFDAAPVGVQLVQTAENYLEVSWSHPINQISDQNYRLVQYRIAVFDGDPAQGARPIFNTQVALPNTTVVRFGPFDSSAYPGQTLYATVRAIYRDVSTDGCPGCRSNYAWGTLSIPQPTETPVPTPAPVVWTRQVDAGGGHNAWAAAACNLGQNTGTGTDAHRSDGTAFHICSTGTDGVRCALPSEAVEESISIHCEAYTCNFCANVRADDGSQLNPSSTDAQCDGRHRNIGLGTVEGPHNADLVLLKGYEATCDYGGVWRNHVQIQTAVAISVPDVICDDKVNATHWSYAIANFGREVPTCQGKTLVNALVLSRIIVAYQKAQ